MNLNILGFNWSIKKFEGQTKILMPVGVAKNKIRF